MKYGLTVILTIFGLSCFAQSNPISVRGRLAIINGRLNYYNGSSWVAVGDSSSSAGALISSNNLSDIGNVGTARANLGLGTAATQNTATFLQTANNLSDITASTARTNLGGTTIGVNLFTLTNPSAAGYLRINADNTVTHQSYANVKTDLSLNNVTNESKDTMFTSPTFTGNAVLGTPASGDFSTGTFTWPNFNQNTTGSAATLTTPRTINGVSFNGSADIVTDPSIPAYSAGGSPWLAQTLDLPLINAGTSTALVDNTVRFVPVWLLTAATLTGIRVYVRTAGSYTGDNNNRVGLYSYSGGTLTLVASSTNSSSLWTSSANAFQTIAFSSTYNASAGLYFVGLLYNNSAQTTAPTLAGGTAFNNVAMVTYQGSNSIKYFGTLGSSNDLPSSKAMSGITGVTASYWVALY